MNFLIEMIFLKLVNLILLFIVIGWLDCDWCYVWGKKLVNCLKSDLVVFFYWVVLCFCLDNYSVFVFDLIVYYCKFWLCEYCGIVW